MEVSQARIRAIQAFLNLPENKARAQRRAELNQEIDDQQERMNNAGRRCAALEEAQRSKCDQLGQRKDLLSRAVTEEAELEKYFQEDLQLRLCSISDGSWNSAPGKPAAESVRRIGNVRPNASVTRSATITSSTTIRF